MFETIIIIIIILLTTTPEERHEKAQQNITQELEKIIQERREQNTQKEH